MKSARLFFKKKKIKLQITCQNKKIIRNLKANPRGLFPDYSVIEHNFFFYYYYFGM